MTTNKQISDAFRKAIPYLITKSYCGHDYVGKSQYICHSIGYGNSNGKLLYTTYGSIAREAVQIVESRTMVDGENKTLLGWLVCKGIPEEDLTFDRVQAHRLAWLKMLVEEFDKDGDYQ